MNYRNNNPLNGEQQNRNSLVVLEFETLEGMLFHTFERALKGMNDVINKKPIAEAFQDIDLMDMDEVTKLLKVSKVTIHNWKKNGIIKSHKMGRKLYFKKGEIIEAIKRQRYSL